MSEIMKATCDNKCGVEIAFASCWNLETPENKKYRFDTAKCAQEWLMREVGALLFTYFRMYAT